MADENVGLAGALYAKSSSVTNHSDNEIAEFRGGWTAEIISTTVDWFGQSTVRKDAEQVQLDIKLTIAEVAFKPGTLETVWGATKDDSAVYLKDASGTTAATSYTLEWLVQCVIDGSILQAFAGDGIALGTSINFTNADYVVYDLEIMLYSASGTLVAFLIEQ